MQFELREINTSRKYFNGSIWNTKNYGKIKIVGQATYCKKRDYPYFQVEFEDGNKIFTTRKSITEGSIKNPWSPTVYGVGFIGRGTAISHNVSEVTREYNLWMHMLSRCYSGNFPTYSDCTVDERWHCYQNFYHDIKNIPGYSRWEENKEKMQIDKDIKIQGNRIYSKDTCLFVTEAENVAESNISGNLKDKKYLATRISDGYIVEFNNMAEFGRRYKCDRGHICKCIMGKSKQHKGWVFKTLDE